MEAHLLIQIRSKPLPAESNSTLFANSFIV